MPRQARIDAPGAIHHIILRGIEKRPIFRDDFDRNTFLERFGRILLETSTPCYAWALIPNHVHFVLRSGSVPIATLMRRLLTFYAQAFNRRHRRHGPLFQNRYKSILCEEEPYLLELVRYIHLNPLRAGLVRDVEALGSYPYSGHAVLLGKHFHEWQDKDTILGMFGKRQRQGRDRYASFVALGVTQGSRPELVGGGLIRSLGGWSGIKESGQAGVRRKGDERILGSGEFIERVLKEAEEAFTEATRLKRRGLSWESLVEEITREYEVGAEELSDGRKDRGVARARSVLCYEAVRRRRMTVRDVALKLRISPSGVSKLVNRGEWLRRAEDG